MLGGVETKDVLALAGTGIDGAQMFPSLHFPDCSHYSIFFDSVISDLFRICLRRDFICGGSRALAYFSFVFRHTNSTTLQCLWVCAGAANCCSQRDVCPAERLGRRFSATLQRQLIAVTRTKRRRRLLIRAQGWSISDNPGLTIKKLYSTLCKGSSRQKPFQGSLACENVGTQGCRWRSNAWAEISQRLRRKSCPTRSFSGSVRYT